MTVLSDREQLSYIASQAADARLNVELETEGMTLNIGPQHPATHGTLRIIARLDGEQVVWAEPSAGYMHRGYEKLTEVRTFPQVTTLINRIDWLGSFANEVPFILAAEKLMEIEAPPRAQVIRTILFELSRIANVSLFAEPAVVGLYRSAGFEEDPGGTTGMAFRHAASSRRTRGGANPANPANPVGGSIAPDAISERKPKAAEDPEEGGTRRSGPER